MTMEFESQYLVSDSNAKLDGKGRFSFPAKYTSMLPDNSRMLYMRPGLDQCIWIQTSAQYQEDISKVAILNDTVREVREFKRLFFKGHEPVFLDATNRISVPKPLLEMAGIHKEIYLTGLGSYIELWNPEIFEKEHLKGSQKEQSELLEKYIQKYIGVGD